MRFFKSLQQRNKLGKFWECVFRAWQDNVAPPTTALWSTARYAFCMRTSSFLLMFFFFFFLVTTQIPGQVACPRHGLSRTWQSHLGRVKQWQLFQLFLFDTGLEDLEAHGSTEPLNSSLQFRLQAVLAWWTFTWFAIRFFIDFFFFSAQGEFHNCLSYPKHT